MPHDTSLLATVAVGLVVAFAFGFAAAKLRLPPLVGYLLAGIAIGPFTPGFVGDGGLAGQLAEIGVILLMFGVGLHFSAADLFAVRGIAVPGAVGQIAVATAIGAVMAISWGWSFGAGLVLGLSLSVASTVVLLKALEERNAVDRPNGRIAIGWLIVEDLAMVLALVLLPALAEALGGQVDPHRASEGSLLVTLVVTLAKVGAFVATTLVLGPRVVPWLLHQAARTGSRELFTLSVLAVALGIAFGSAVLFGVSFALGAFFAGVVLNGSDLSHKAAAESLPLQDAFAVIFFVSVGMLFDPAIVVREPAAVAAVVLLVVAGKSIAALAIVLGLGFPLRTALTVSMSLAQIGEFSFILAGLGMSLGLLPAEGRDLILAAALLSITLNPLAFAAIDPLVLAARRRPKLWALLERSRVGKLRALERELEAARRRLEEAAPRRLEPEELARRFPLFAGLGEAQRHELLDLFRSRTAHPGERLIRAGDPAEEVFFIASGEVEVSVAGRKVTLGPGDHFGEIALLARSPRSADVTALDYGEYLTLDHDDFEEFLRAHPEIARHVAELAERRRDANSPAAGSADRPPF